MEYSEEMALSRAAYKPTCWFCYVDDLASVVQKTERVRSPPEQHPSQHPIHHGDCVEQPPALYIAIY